MNANAKYLLVREVAKNDLLVRQCTFFARCSILSYTRCNSVVSIQRIDTAELHHVYDNMLH